LDYSWGFSLFFGPWEEVYNLELRNIGGEPFYWLNDHILVHAVTGERKPIISELEARKIAAMQMSPDLELLSVTYIEEVGSHHEYRGKPLPAYLLEYRDPRNITAYVSARDGKLQSIRHRSWRWFDFLWMLHTMDYQGRDNFNTALLRAFSVLGLITVGSGFGLWYVTSRRRRNLFRVFSKGNSKEKQDQ
jgi:hypothetical protein